MIVLQGVSKSFQKEKVLSGINIDIKEGECIVLRGVSGSGKSTLLSIIATLMKADEGSVSINGLDVLSMSDYDLSEYRKSLLGFVPQSFHLFEMLSVRENIVPGLLLNDLDSKEIQERVDKVMQIASINHKEKTQAGKLSGGEKQRCMIARALVNDPKIVLCDEPTANLDKQNSLKFASIIKDLKEQGKTIIIATHDPLISELEFIDRVIKIDGGSIE